MADVATAFGDVSPPGLTRALRRAPTPPEPASPPDLAKASTVEKGHGRIERTREIGGRVSREVACAVTSLPSDQPGPDRLPGLWRDRWLIENRPHWRRDGVAREGHGRLRSPRPPRRPWRRSATEARA